MKVYVVVYEDYNDYEVERVFLKKEDAEKYAESRRKESKVYSTYSIEVKEHKVR